MISHGLNTRGAVVSHGLAPQLRSQVRGALVDRTVSVERYKTQRDRVVSVPSRERALFAVARAVAPSTPVVSTPAVRMKAAVVTRGVTPSNNVVSVPCLSKKTIR